MKPCPFCGDAHPYIHTEYETDGSEAVWKFVKCQSCGVRTRGKWFTRGNDCPQFYDEVRDEWNVRKESK